MQKPATCFDLAGNLNRTSLSPVRRRELFGLFQLIDYCGQHRTFPSARLSVIRQALNRVPLSTVDFPRHFCVGTDAVGVQVP